jgi:hypothetical protein
MAKPHAYRGLSPDNYEELFSNFLMDSWSFSKVNSFSRNEKAFEMSYIYRVPSRRSASTIAGQAYHAALEHYFLAVKDGKKKDIIDLQQVAFGHIEEVPSNEWKLQKTTPTMEQCILSATEITTKLIDNFFQEKAIYNFKEIISVEKYYDEFVTVNGVDIPLPCHAKLDLVAKTHDDKIVVVDHKSKSIFSDEKALAFSIGKQAVTYYHTLDAGSDMIADEVWFVENKYSKNRDGSPQLNCFKSIMDEDTIRLYDALLYEPLKRMMEAISNPDYVYLMNESDNYIDSAELHAFWAQTMIAEVDEFNIPDSKKGIIRNRLKKIRDSTLATINPSIIKNFRKNASEFIQFDLNSKNMTTEEKIEHVLRTLGIIVKVSHKFEGYSNDTYLLEMSAGTNLSSIFRYKLDIANALNVPSIRINKELFIYENKSYIAIEAPKKRVEDLFFDPVYLKDMKIPVGLDNFKSPVVWDLENQSTPHVLICGATGSGKSVAIITILEYAKLSGIKDIIIFDPKLEFTKYNGKNGIEVFNDIDDIETMMEFLVEEMNERIQKGSNSKKLILFDEFADAVSASRKGKELDIKEMVQVGEYRSKKGPMGFQLPPEPKMKLMVVGRKKSLEENLKVLAQKGRSCGFRILAATQRASVKVITGDAKVNFPVQICFRVPKEIDSKVVLGESGAEALTGRGDGLISSPEYLDLVRFQAFYKE